MQVFPRPICVMYNGAKHHFFTGHHPSNGFSLGHGIRPFSNQKIPPGITKPGGEMQRIYGKDAARMWADATRRFFIHSSLFIVYKEQRRPCPDAGRMPYRTGLLLLSL